MLARGVTRLDGRRRHASEPRRHGGARRAAVRGLRPIVRPEDEIDDRRPGRRRNEDIIDRQKRERFGGEDEAPLSRRHCRRNDDRPYPGKRENIDENVGRLPCGRELARACGKRAPQRIDSESGPEEGARHRAEDQDRRRRGPAPPEVAHKRERLPRMDDERLDPAFVYSFAAIRGRPPLCVLCL
jgi:hypothetical protein